MLGLRVRFRAPGVSRRDILPLLAYTKKATSSQLHAQVWVETDTHLSEWTTMTISILWLPFTHCRSQSSYRAPYALSADSKTSAERVMQQSYHAASPRRLARLTEMPTSFSDSVPGKFSALLSPYITHIMTPVCIPRLQFASFPMT